MEKQVLRVGVGSFPPLVMKNGEVFQGFEIELWQKIASEIACTFSYQEYAFKDLLPALADRRIDMALSGITMTEEREKIFDFSHKTTDSSVRILIQSKVNFGILAIIGSLFNRGVLKITVFLIMFVVLSAHAVWWAEQDGGGTLSGPYIPAIYNSLWWALVTVATIGYGDYTPVTLLGRVFAIFSIFSGLAIFGLYIAEISSAITLNRLQSDISGFKDLAGKQVATVQGTTSESVVEEHGAIAILVATPDEAYQLLEKGVVRAVVFDEPALLYYADHAGSGKVHVVGEPNQRQSYGIALSNGSPLREPINQAILKLYENGEYARLYKKWFGEEY